MACVEVKTKSSTASQISARRFERMMSSDNGEIDNELRGPGTEGKAADEEVLRISVANESKS